MNYNRIVSKKTVLSPRKLSTLIFLMALNSISVYSQNIFPKADSILISRFGSQFFQKYIKIGCAQCYCYTSKPNVLIDKCNNFDSTCTSYHLSYFVDIPEKEIKIQIQFIATKSGDLVDFTVNQSHNSDTMWHSTNLPPLNFPHEQLNFLSRKEIEQIATIRNFPKGIKAWRFSTNFMKKPYEEWYMNHETEKIKKWGNGKFVSSLNSQISQLRNLSISFDAVTGEYLFTLVGVGIP